MHIFKRIYNIFIIFQNYKHVYINIYILCHAVFGFSSLYRALFTEEEYSENFNKFVTQLYLINIRYNNK